MNKSESIKELATALSKVQAEMKPAPLNMKNDFLKTSYADLGSIIETAKPVLEKHELSVSQLPMSIAENIGIETVLMHSSGEWISSVVVMPIAEKKGITLVQVAGSMISYLRRYSLAAILGMYAGEDNDGQSGNGNNKPPVEETGQRNWPAYMRNALVDIGIVQNEAHGDKFLDLFPNLPKNTSKDRVIELGKIYRARRAMGTDDELQPPEAAEVAWNEWSE